MCFLRPTKNKTGCRYMQQTHFPAVSLIGGRVEFYQIVKILTHFLALNACVVCQDCFSPDSKPGSKHLTSLQVSYGIIFGSFVNVSGPRLCQLAWILLSWGTCPRISWSYCVDAPLCLSVSWVQIQKILTEKQRNRPTIFFSTQIQLTLPETNVAPENGWLEYYFPIGFRPIFRGVCR